jgi:hypothetical protein
MYSALTENFVATVRDIVAADKDTARLTALSAAARTMKKG